MKSFSVLIPLFLLFSACGTEEKADPVQPVPQPTPTPPGPGGQDPNAEFAAEIKPLLQKNCAGGACHTSGGSRDAVIQSANNFVKGTSGARIQGGTMPPPNSSQAKNFPATEKNELLSFIAKYK